MIHTLKKQCHFQSIYTQRNIVDTPYFRVYKSTVSKSTPKYAIVASKKIGNAVNRNKLKRQVRAVLTIDNLIKDTIIVIKKKAKGTPFKTLKLSLEKRLY